MMRERADDDEEGGLSYAEAAKREEERREVAASFDVCVEVFFVDLHHPRKNPFLLAISLLLLFYTPAQLQIGHRPLSCLCAGQCSLPK